MAPIIIGIDGNYCSGKSLLIKILKNILKESSDVVILEDVDYISNEFIQNDEDNIFKKLYSNPKKYSFSYLMLSLMDKLSVINKIIKENPDAFIIMENSIICELHVHAKYLFDNKLIDALDYHIYKSYYDEYTKHIQPSGIIYMDTLSSICGYRITSQYKFIGLSMNYLCDYSNYYKQWIKTTPFLFLRIDGSTDIKKKKYVIKTWIQNIFQFLLVFSKSYQHKKQFTFVRNYPYENVLYEIIEDGDN